MQKIINILLVVVFTTCIIPSYAQTTFNISGNIKNSSSKELLPAVSVTIKNTTMGTFTDDKGNFIIPTSQSFPLTLVVSSIGFETQEIQVLSVNEPVSILLKPTTALGQDVVVSATRVATKILESPVSIERMNTSFIRKHLRHLFMMHWAT
ncbi:MAG TPA: carboxypeptidase-like regulatory domain-containing protein [Chitinophagaceae bacterium]|nr:carboxypeptidase-like regulatory domain-containing protein [Chitinophagaceae bacterium]